MYVTRYRPNGQRQDRFSSFLEKFLEQEAKSYNGDFIPTVNTREEDNAYHIELDLPGVKKEDIDVDVKDNLITISGERKIQKEVNEEDYYSIESRYGKFERSFTLPEDVDVGKIEANSTDGVLEVVIPKKPKKENKPKKIKIK
jgi:HSP20 family protein